MFRPTWAVVVPANRNCNDRQIALILLITKDDDAERVWQPQSETKL